MPSITRDKLSQPRKLIVLLGMLLALFLADAVITRFLVRHGLATEANPMLGFWVTTDQFMWVKLGAGLLACFLLWDLYRRAGKPIVTIAIILVFVFAVIVGWNVAVAIMSLVDA